MNHLRLLFANAFLLSACQRRLSEAGFAPQAEGLCLRLDYAEAKRPLLAHGLAAFIFGERESYRLYMQISHTFCDFGAEEKAFLVTKAKQSLRAETLTLGLFAGRRRAMLLAQALEAFLQENDCLHLEGFIRFRMSGYEEYLLATLGVSADDIMARQEDMDYQQILHKFVEERANGGEYHLLLLANGSYSLFSGDGRLRVLEGGREQDFEDLLVARILLLSPERMVVHLAEGREPGKAAEMLGLIFGKRIRFCHGCSLCRQSGCFLGE